jgi:hypothetical protein
MFKAKLSKAADWLHRRRTKVRLSAPVMAMLSDDWGADHVGYYGHETPADLLRLADVLAAHPDASHHPAVLSANMVCMEPDFEAIGRAGFQRYSARDAYAGRPEMLAAWDRLRQRGVISQEFHGRDHFNAAMWLDELRAGQADFVEAFRTGKVLFKSPSWERLVAEKPCRAMLAREFIDCRRSPSVPIPATVQAGRVREGVGAFERLFGFRPRCAVASGAAFDAGTEFAWARADIEYCHAPGYNRVCLDAAGDFELQPRFYGEHTEAGLNILIGNAEYEPGNEASEVDRAVAAAKATADVIGRALARREPVFMATHAQNYYGDQRKTSANLAGLDALLATVRRRFPDLLFAATRDLADLIYYPARAPERLAQVECKAGLTTGLLLKEVAHSLRRSALDSRED